MSAPQSRATVDLLGAELRRTAAQSGAEVRRTLSHPIGASVWRGAGCTVPHNETAAQPSVSSAPEPSPAEKLRQLAARIARLGIGGRTDPEHITVEKLSVVAELRAMARAIERAA